MATTSKKRVQKSGARTKKASSRGSSTTTRTTSRSAKRRSPKPDTTVEEQQREWERTEFLRAMDKYKRKTGKTFPNWSEVLEVLRSLGWVHPKSAEKLAGQAPKRPAAS